jgi:hypothetical protein
MCFVVIPEYKAKVAPMAILPELLIEGFAT